MENNYIFKIALRGILTFSILVIYAFVYVYLTELNPIIYFNIIIWYYFSILLALFPIYLMPTLNNNVLEIILNILISSITIYLVYGMKSSLFFSKVLSFESFWYPVVNFGDIIKTLTSFSEYKDKLHFLSEFDSLNISYKGRPGIDTGSSFTNIMRITECIGFLTIPIYATFKKHKED